MLEAKRRSLLQIVIQKLHFAIKDKYIWQFERNTCVKLSLGRADDVGLTAGQAAPRFFHPPPHLCQSVLRF